MDNASLTKPDLVKVRCNRKISRNKYEQNAPEIQNWWYKLFDVLEADAAIKPERKLPLLQEVFPARFLNKILRILSVENIKFKGDLPAPVVEEHKKKKKSDSSMHPDTIKSFIDPREKERCEKDMDSTASSVTIRARFGETEPVKENPYLNFFKRQPDRAAIWRELPPLRLADMNLSQKADAIARAIATNFVEWIKTLGGDQATTISVESVMEMFEIASQNNSTKSLKVQLKEMPSVSPKVADYMRAPESSRTVMLHREIRRDKLATKKKHRLIAFGRRLPSEMQVRPLDAKPFRKWHSCDGVPEKIASMAAVWQGITHLRSTKAFCEYIFNERADVRAPKYLVDTGMMDPKSFSVKQDSEMHVDSFGNISRMTARFTEF